MQHAEIVIIGAGVMGASVAYHLAVRGIRDLIILERGAAPVAGSTGRSAAGVRHQFSSTTNVRLSQYSIQRLKHFCEEVGGDAGLQQIGYMFAISNEADWQTYQQNVAMQRALGVRVEMLEPEAATRFVPGLRTNDLVGVTYGPDDGFCDPVGLALGYLEGAKALGARVRTNAPVDGITVRNGAVAGVQSSAGAISCDTVVNAAGPWAGAVAALAGIELPVRPVRRSVFVTEPFDELPDAIPLTIDVSSGFWMRRGAGRVVMGLARPDEPSGFNTDVDWDWFTTVHRAGVARYPRLADARVDAQRSWAGLYEVTPDANPILGRHPDITNYVDVSGFSGHGIMHSPAAGMLIAEEIIDGRAHTIPIDELRIERFAQHSVGEHNVF